MRRTRDRVLGYASIGSGAAMLLLPRPMGRVYGLPLREPWLRAIGARDVVIGVGLLAAPDPSPWMRARAASEWMDAGLIALAGEGSAGLAPLRALAAVLFGMWEARAA